MHPLARLDHQYVWHPFTQMRDWLRQEPIVIVAGRGPWLRDVHGREYLDANASIWTNLHGHNHPRLNAALIRQLRKIAHSSALGLANEPASLLAAELVRAAHMPGSGVRPSHQRLSKVFYSDDGSTALEVALKLAYEFTRRTRGPASRPRFLSLQGAYHGDTLGAVALGHIPLFHQTWRGLLFKTDTVMAPYCYRCPYNRARPERADARLYRQCRWECIEVVARQLERQRRMRGEPYAAFVVEPLIQGAAGMIPQPQGWLTRIAELLRLHNTLLIADEVMTGFGRVGLPLPPPRQPDRAPLFACQLENVSPDFLCLAKGLTGGYLPLAATLTTREVFDAFLGRYEEFKTFFHGHSYTANQLGTATALENLRLLRTRASLRARLRLQQALAETLPALWDVPQVGDIRQVGLVVGIELVRDWTTREPFDLREQAGIRVCRAMARRGVLTRPIGNVIVLMPPYCTTPAQIRKIVETLMLACEETLGRPSRARSKSRVRKPSIR
ncbi:adenosylmethionine--8-amino-7-oxononanoate transaminase [Limisphaera sp. VF-2]|jgi:adenosylmethionine-8-amino-7-oxononanoate aminotransferase|uniref:adenosylmethionine--8-amino-7-oxononanoate transaminase n=1 Tax=Limisphaera sp. VF-2 TaxID=3400418 RepID=UPI0017639AA0